MNILMVGTGRNGSWAIRGAQLGAAMGARVTTAPTVEDWRWADVVVLVKRALLWAPTAHKYGKVLIWDALDFWRQPLDNGFTETEARALLDRRIVAVQPDLIVGATAAMAEAAHGIYVPHHAWADLTAPPVRERIERVGYEGSPAYLGRWHAALVTACETRGWTLVINPPSLAHVDLVVAFRDGPWDGWMCREWKSGVKAVNAIVAGRPFLSQPSAAVRELQPLGTVLDHPFALDDAFDEWIDPARRAVVVAEAARRAPWFTVESVAHQYRAFLTAFNTKEATP